MKILMVTGGFPPEFGGAVVQAIVLAKALKRQGVEVEFVTDNGVAKTKEDVFDDFKVYRLKTFFTTRQLRGLVYTLRLMLFVLKNKTKYDVVHFHSISGYYELIIFPVLKLFNQKIVMKLTLVGCDDPATLKNKKLSFLVSWGLNFVDKFVAISGRLVKLCVQAKIDKQKIENITNGIDVNKFVKAESADKRLLQQKFGFLDYKHIFLSIGKIYDRKEYLFLLRSWKYISMRLPCSALVIIGPGNVDSNGYYVRLKKMISDENLRNVFFLGEKYNVNEYMKISDCFLFCSIREGFGTVQIEALASSVPIVTRYIEGISEDIFIDKHLGKICYTNSPTDFAECAISVAEEKRTPYFDEAIKKIRSTFDIDLIALKYTHLYKRLVTPSSKN